MILPDLNPLDKDKAVEFSKEHRFKITTGEFNEDEGEDTPDKHFCHISANDLSIGGSGYVLYLSMIQHFAYLFAFLTLLNIPIYYRLAWIYNNQNEGGYNYTPKLIFSLDILQYGSIYSGVSYNPTTGTAGSDLFIYSDDMKTNWLEVFVWINIASIVCVCLFVWYWYRRTNAIIEQVDAETFTPSDYTLEVYNIPVHASSAEVKQLCLSLYPEHVYEVYVVKKFDDRINKFNALVQAAKVLRDCRTANYRKEIEDESKDKTDVYEDIMRPDFDDATKSAYDAFVLCSSECDKIEESGFDIDDFDNLYAYVTFTYEKNTFELLEKQLEANFCACFSSVENYPEELTYEWEGKKNKFLLKPASEEPGDIMWENLGMDKKEKWTRIIIYLLILLAVISLSFIAIYYGQVYINSLPTPSNCGTEWTQDLATMNTTYSSSADKVQSDFIMSGFYTYLKTLPACSSGDMNCYYESLAANNNLRYCFCQTDYTTNGYTSTNKYACKEEFSNMTMLQWAPLLMTIFTLVMNTVMLYTVLLSTPITRPKSKTELVARQTTMIFVTQFMNMAIIPLIVASTNEITETWYQNVGLAILYNFFLFSITPNLSGFLSPMINMYKSKLMAYYVAADQEDYNFLWAGPDFLDYVYVRYSYFLCLVTCCLMFSASMPILYLIGAFGLTFMYFIEKYTSIYLYRKVDFASDLNEYSNYLFPFVIILQCIWANWIYSNPYFFQDNITDADHGIVANSAWGVLMKITSISALDSMGQGYQPGLYYIRNIPFTLIALAALFWVTLGPLVYKIIWYAFCCFMCSNDASFKDEIESANDDKMFDPSQMETVVNTYAITDNLYYADIISAIHANDNDQNLYKVDNNGSGVTQMIDGQNVDRNLPIDDGMNPLMNLNQIQI